MWGALLLAASAACRATTYVSPEPPCDDGPSSGSSSASPLCSISVALARVASTAAAARLQQQQASSSGFGSGPHPGPGAGAAAAAAAEDKDVVLLAGTFWLNDSLRLTAEHSGLTLRSSSPARAILSGGVAVTGWAESADRRFAGLGVWSAQLPSDVTGKLTPRQLYVDGVRATRTSGNASEILGGMTFSPIPLTEQNPREGGLPGYRVANAKLAGWENVNDIELVYTAMTQPWIAPRCRVRSVSTNHTLTMERCLDAIGPGRSAASVGQGWPWWMSGLPATIENALELLSEPGTFYASSDSGLVHYIPRASQDMRVASVFAPKLKTLLKAEGTANLSLSGIDFLHTSWLEAQGTCGYVPQQAGMRRGTSFCSAFDDHTNTATEPLDQQRRRPPPAGISFVLGSGGRPSIRSSGSRVNTMNSLVSQSGSAKMTLGPDGSFCVWVEGQTHEPLGYCLTAGTGSGELLLQGPAVTNTLLTETNATKQCAASHCDAASCPLCCGQPGGAAPPAYTCPKALPLCTNYIANHSWGVCGPGPIECAADHGQSRPCCGQGGGGVGPEYQCPADKPTCTGYIENHGWGRCDKLGTKGFFARIVNQSVCVADIGTNFTIFCSETAGTTSSDAGDDPHYLMLSDDGAVCIHSGTYLDDEQPGGTVWCLPAAWAHPLPGEGENHVARIPGGVQLKSVTNAVVDGCSFRHMGGSGLDMWGGVQHSTVSGCFATDISGTGIQIGSTAPCPQCLDCGGCRGVPCHKPPTFSQSVRDGMSPPCPRSPSSSLLELNITVEDNVIADVGAEYQGCAGVWAGVTVQLKFRHNEICRVPYSGISLGWNWAIPEANTVQRDNEISFNRISYWLQSRLADGDATYTLAPQPNSKLHHNYIYSGASGTEPGGATHGSGYYPDDGSEHWKIYSNVARNLSGGSWLFAWNDVDEKFLEVYDNYADTNRSRLCCAVSQLPTPTCSSWNNTVVDISVGHRQSWRHLECERAVGTRMRPKVARSRATILALAGRHSPHILGNKECASCKRFTGEGRRQARAAAVRSQPSAIRTLEVSANAMRFKCVDLQLALALAAAAAASAASAVAAALLCA